MSERRVGVVGRSSSSEVLGPMDPRWRRNMQNRLSDDLQLGPGLTIDLDQKLAVLQAENPGPGATVKDVISALVAAGLMRGG